MTVGTGKPPGTAVAVGTPSSLRRRTSLRRRLVAVVIGLIAVVAASMGLVSTLALQGTLVGQLDVRLLASSNRAAAVQLGNPPPTDTTYTPLSPDTTPDGDTMPDGVPPSLGAPGQGTGTVTVESNDGVVRGGYIDETGTFQQLDATQQEALLEVATDGRPRTVELDGLGSYRVVAEQVDTGRTIITGLSMADTTSTISTYLVGEALIVVVGLAVAALAGTVLVRRELVPLERVAATAARVTQQPLDRGAVTLERVSELDVDDTTEVGQVGTALNELLGHVEAALAARHESETQVRQFVADASHELRTPLASIRGYAELVRRLPEGLPDDAVRAMERVESESRRMTALVEDMLLLARLDAGRPLERAEVDLAALAVDAVTDAHVAAPDHAWRLDVGSDDEDDDSDPQSTTVLGDDHRLRQVLANLLANARVHTPPGTTVTTSVHPEDRDVVVRVRDDGPGISPELVPRLFQRFTRGNAARSPGAGSTGLGLAIVQAVVAAHGGRIEVDGTPGATTITVRLPVAV